MTELLTADDASIERAAELLNQGKLVAFPTETVYGLGADASNAEAVRGIFSAKGRPADHPLIVHIGSPEQISAWAASIPESARRLAERFWPGPLTLILKKRPEVPDEVTGGQDTVGLRIPNNPVALRLLQAFGGGIAAPSANRFKRISPTQAIHVAEELDGRVDLILDGGPCHIGVESTIVDLSGNKPRLLRPGSISQADIERVLQTKLNLITAMDGEIPNAPGMMAVHYAPTTSTRLCPENRLVDTIQELTAQGKTIGLLTYRFETESTESLRIVRLPDNTEDYAQGLYAALRELDKLQLDTILVEQPPATPEWHAVNDRLKKAAAAFGKN